MDFQYICLWEEGCWSHLLCAETKFTVLWMFCTLRMAAASSQNKAPVVHLWEIVHQFICGMWETWGEGGGRRALRSRVRVVQYVCGVARSASSSSECKWVLISWPLRLEGFQFVWVCGGDIPGPGWEVRSFTEDKQDQRERERWGAVRTLAYDKHINSAELGVAYFSTNIEPAALSYNNENQSL